MYANILPAYMYVHYMSALPMEAFGIGLTDSCEPFWSSKSKLDPLEQ